MAIWEVYERADGDLGINYRNRLTGQCWGCGVLRRDTHAKLILAWIMSEGDAAPWDWVTLPGGGLLPILPGLIEPEARSQAMLSSPEPRPDWRRRC